MDLTGEERTLLLLYYDENRDRTLKNLAAMKAELQAYERELRSLTESVIRKLEAVTEEEFRSLDLFGNEVIP